MSLSHAEFRVVLASILSALFLAALDQTIVATALPSIAADLGNFDLLSWVVTSYLLTATCSTPILGKLSDIYGRPLLLNIALVTFLVGSVICALAPDMLSLIGARALQGIGGGALITLVQAIIGDLVSPRDRGRYIAYFASVWATAAVAGPTLGGFLTATVGWHWIFWINVPIGLVVLLVVHRVLRRVPFPRRPARIDYGSILLFTIGSTALLLAVTWGGVAHPWLSAWVLGAFLAAILAGGAFLFRQARTGEPILPLHYFSDDVIGRVLPTVFLIFGGYLSLVVLIPTYLQVARQVSVAEVGLLLIPLTLSAPVAASITGRHMRRTGDYKRPPLVGIPVSCAALLVMAIWASSLSPLTAAGLLVLVGLGLGTTFPTSLLAVQNAAHPREMGTATGALAFFRALGGATVTAALSALLLGLVVVRLPEIGGVAGLEDLVRQPLAPADRAIVANAFSVVFLAILALFAASWVIFLKVGVRPLRDHTGHHHAEGAEASA